MSIAQFQPKKISRRGEILGHFNLSTSKVICVGRNYVNHAKELNNPVPKEPLLFIKPNSCVVDLQDEIAIPTGFGECHHELEVALLITSPLTKANEKECLKAIGGIGLALDLTLRALQGQLKSRGEPWEKAKSFDGACPVTGFIELDNEVANYFAEQDFRLTKNGLMAQHGKTNDMIFNSIDLVKDISQYFSLYPGDIVLTGTPEGVAALEPGDELELLLNQHRIACAKVKAD